MSDNTDELFQRMCLKADELQEKHTIALWDTVWLKRGGLYVVTGKALSPPVYELSSKSGKDFIHLATMPSTDITGCIFSLDQLWAWWLEECKPSEKAIRRTASKTEAYLYELTYSGIGLPYAKTLKEWVLRALMQEICHKRWDGEAWVAIRKERKCK